MTQIEIQPKAYLANAMSYPSYVSLVEQKFAEGRSTGPEDLPEKFVQFSGLNLRRMRRVRKTFRKTPELIAQLKNFDIPMQWLIITEGWCGDAATAVPVIEGIAEEMDKVSTHYVLRDKNLDLMDQFLTNGGRSIPKLIALEKESGDILFQWGPRPEPAKELFLQNKSGWDST